MCTWRNQLITQLSISNTGLFCPVFRCHSKIRPFANRTTFDHLITGLVRYSDGYSLNLKRSRKTAQVWATYLSLPVSLMSPWVCQNAIFRCNVHTGILRAEAWKKNKTGLKPVLRTALRGGRKCKFTLCLIKQHQNKNLVSGGWVGTKAGLRALGITKDPLWVLFRA